MLESIFDRIGYFLNVFISGVVTVIFGSVFAFLVGLILTVIFVLVAVIAGLFLVIFSFMPREALENFVIKNA